MIRYIGQTLQAIGAVILIIGKLVMLLVTSFWAILVLTGSLLVTLLPQVEAALEWLTTHLGATWDILGDAGADAGAAIAAGWPPEIANGLVFANAYFPLAEAFGMVIVLMTASATMAVNRIVFAILRGA